MSINRIESITESNFSNRTNSFLSHIECWIGFCLHERIDNIDKLKPKPIFQAMLDPPIRSKKKLKKNQLTIDCLHQNYLLIVGYGAHLVGLVGIEIRNVCDTEEAETDALSSYDNFRWIKCTTSKTSLMYCTKA